MPNIRTFIAIELSDAIQQVLEETITSLKKSDLNGIRWVAAKNIHLTLKFLGDIPEYRLPELSSSMESVLKDSPSFEIQISKVGVFPNLRRPRVVWIGVREQPLLNTLQARIENQTARLGFSKEDRAFSPHLTLVRVKNEASQEQLQKIAAAISTLPAIHPVSMTVENITLFKSELLRTGSIYTPLFTANLHKQNST